MLKRLALAALACCVVAGCSNDSSGPTAPTPAPQPQFSSLVGGWTGTLTINASIAGLSGSNSCTQSWTITSQTSGNFSGTFQLSGGTAAPCAQSGTVSGTITAAGAFTDLTFGVQVNPITNCTRVALTPYAGNVTGGTSINVQSTETLSCNSGGTSATGTRSLVIALTKR
jgi:hypothetical protein